VSQSLVGIVKSIGVGDCYDDTCPGLLYQMWAVGYGLYLGWMCMCTYFVIIGTWFQMITFRDWTSSMPLGILGCHRVMEPFL